MNNTTTTKRTTLTIAAIFMAAALIVGATLATTTHSAYAYQKKDNGKGNGNGNTVTIQKCKQAAIQSGWDNDQEQECENLICTHPGNNATCSREGTPVAGITTGGGIVCTIGGATGSVLVTFTDITTTPFCADREDLSLTTGGTCPANSGRVRDPSGTFLCLHVNG